MSNGHQIGVYGRIRDQLIGIPGSLIFAQILFTILIFLLWIPSILNNLGYAIDVGTCHEIPLKGDLIILLGISPGTPLLLWGTYLPYFVWLIYKKEDKLNGVSAALSLGETVSAILLLFVLWLLISVLEYDLLGTAADYMVWFRGFCGLLGELFAERIRIIFPTISLILFTFRFKRYPVACLVYVALMVTLPLFAKSYVDYLVIFIFSSSIYWGLRALTKRSRRAQPRDNIIASQPQDLTWLDFPFFPRFINFLRVLSRIPFLVMGFVFLVWLWVSPTSQAED